MIAHWPSLPAKLAGKVIGIEHGKYYVEYDDGDKHHNTIEQLRILKPPLYFGKLKYYLLACEQTLLLRNINSAKKHSRPQSPSFLGHVVLKRGRLLIKPSGFGHENG